MKKFNTQPFFQHHRLALCLCLSQLCISTSLYAQTEQTDTLEDAPSETVAVEKVRFSVGNIEELDGKRSLMFNTEQLLDLYTILKTSRARPEGAPYPPDVSDTQQETAPVFQEPEKEKIKDSGNFYLNSILYISPESWSVWINGTKVTVNQLQSNPQIIKTEKNSVEFVWQNLEMHIDNPNWTKHMQHIPGTPEYISLSEEEKESYNHLSVEEKNTLNQQSIDNFEQKNFLWNYIDPNTGIRVDSTNQIIGFTLQAHQSFIGDTLSLIEGKQASLVQSSAKSTSTPSNTTPPSNEPESSSTEAHTGEDNFDDLVNEIFSDSDL